MNETKPSAALERIDSTARVLRPIADGKTLFAAREEIQSAIVDALIPGVDVIYTGGSATPTKPGEKPALSKAGAEKVRGGMGCTVEMTIVEKEIDHDRKVTSWNRYKNREETSLGLYRYVVKATVLTRDGFALGSRLGVCSTMESKYVSRPRDCEHTSLAMAQKRAEVAATLAAFGLSDRLTSDTEDMQPEPARPTMGGTPRSAPAASAQRSSAQSREPSGRTVAAPGPSAPQPVLDVPEGPALDVVHAALADFDGSVALVDLEDAWRAWKAVLEGPMGASMTINVRWGVELWFRRRRGKLGGKPFHAEGDQETMLDVLASSWNRSVMETDAVEREPSGPTEAAPLEGEVMQ